MVDAFCVSGSTRIWMDFVAIWRLSWVSFCLGRCWWSRLDLRRFGLICIVSVGFDIFLLIWAYFTWLQWFGRLGWVRIELGIFGELGFLNLIGFFEVELINQNSDSGSVGLKQHRWRLLLKSKYINNTFRMSITSVQPVTFSLVNLIVRFSCSCQFLCKSDASG